MDQQPDTATTPSPAQGLAHEENLDGLDETLATLVEAFRFKQESDYHITTPALLQRAFSTACGLVRDHGAHIAQALGDTKSTERKRVECALRRFTEENIEDRVPGIPPAEMELAARYCVTLTLGMLLSLCEEGKDNQFEEQEMVFIVSAYLYARFPPTNDFAWHVQERAIQPSRPSRRDFRQSTRVWPAHAPGFNQ